MVTLFERLAVTVDFDDASLQKYGEFIIQSFSCLSAELAIRGIRKCCKFMCEAILCSKRLFKMKPTPMPVVNGKHGHEGRIPVEFYCSFL